MEVWLRFGYYLPQPSESDVLLKCAKPQRYQHSSLRFSRKLLPRWSGKDSVSAADWESIT